MTDSTTSSTRPTPSTPSDRRGESRGPDRRREGWHSFRSAYPTFLRIAAVLFLLLAAADIWLGYRRHQYNVEIGQLRASMTDAERKKSDVVVESEQDKLRVALALAKRQAQFDPHLHLAIAVDSGLMYLERDGAIMRVMRVSLAPAKVPANVADNGPGATAKGDTTATALPRGERTVQQIVDGPQPALVLNGDARIYAGGDSGTVSAGNVRANDADLRAILPNVSAGMPVYFY
ncbi:MAG: hypothetical protein ACR2M1_07945 [Gemmatimonadaceae bacterium]